MTAITIAQTIQRQIGTDAWLAVSARNASYCETPEGTQLRFRFGDRYGLAKWCEITYKRGSDDYAIAAYKIRRNGKREALAFYEGVYADSLGFLIRDINLEAELS